MVKKFPELPSWSFDIREVANSIYMVTATNLLGNRVELTGMDPDVLLSDARQSALGIEQAIAGRSKGPPK